MEGDCLELGEEDALGGACGLPGQGFLFRGEAFRGELFQGEESGGVGGVFLEEDQSELPCHKQVSHGFVALGQGVGEQVDLEPGQGIHEDARGLACLLLCLVVGGEEVFQALEGLKAAWVLPEVQEGQEGQEAEAFGGLGVGVQGAQHFLGLLEFLRGGGEDTAALSRLVRESEARGDCVSLSGLAVNGHDLVAAGIPAGREMGRVLNRLLELVLTAPEKNVPATLIEEARRWV